nr:F113 [uncultured bacterium]
MTFEFTIYATAAVASLTPAVFVRRGVVPARGWLLLACTLSAVWALALAVGAEQPQFYRTVWPFLAELARAAGWQGFLIGLLRHEVVRESSSRRAVNTLLAIAMLLWSGAVVSITVPLGVLPGPLLAFLILAVFGLVVLEQSYRHAGSSERWRLKFAWLGLGALFASDLYLYSEAALFGSVNPSVWAARGIVSAVASGLIAVSVLRMSRHLETVTVSRQFLFRSTALLVAGAYLLFVSAAGYYIQHFQGSWASALGAAFVVCALLLLASVATSGRFRAWLKVKLSKHFFRYKFDYREEWLRFNAMLADPESQAVPRDRAIRALADLVDSPAGLLWSRGSHDVYHLTANWNGGHQGLLPLPAGHALVRFLQERQWIIDVAEAQAQAERYQGLLWPDWWAEIKRPWLVLPLMEQDNLRGFVVLAQPRSPRELNWEDRDLLRTASRQIAGYVALLETSDALMSSRQFDAFNRLSAYLVHDLKNVSAQLGLVSANAERHKSNPAFIEDALETVANAKQRMDRLLDQLRKATPLRPPPPVTCDLSDLLQQVVNGCADRLPMPTLELPLECLRVNASAERLSTVLTNLIHNAQEASAVDGQVTVSLCRQGEFARFVVEDRGCGMDETFLREKLFRPFATTKGNAGMGIGMYETRDYVEDLGGILDINSRPGEGTRVDLLLPLTEASVRLQASGVGEVNVGNA